MHPGFFIFLYQPTNHSISTHVIAHKVHNLKIRQEHYGKKNRKQNFRFAFPLVYTIFAD